MSDILVIATKNKGKLTEFKRYFKNTDFTIKSIDEIYKEDEDIAETGKTFEENAIIKALYYSDKIAYPIIGEDSGLSIDVLDGFPGIYSARIGKTDEERNNIILKKLAGKKGTQRRACFITVIAMVYKGKLIKTFKGKVCGYILDKARGNNGFGYDPIFYYKPLKKTFAEIKSDIKNRYSHRGRAIKKLLNYLKSKGLKADFYS